MLGKDYCILTQQNKIIIIIKKKQRERKKRNERFTVTKFSCLIFLSLLRDVGA